MSAPNHNDSSSPKQAFHPVGLLNIFIAQLNEGQFRTESPQRAIKADRARAAPDDDSVSADDKD